MSYVSTKLRKSAGHPEARCMFQIAGVCEWNGTQVLCHLPIKGTGGMGQKCDDTQAAFGCMACHDVMDGRRRHAGMEKDSRDWNFYALRALARQYGWWIEHGYLTEKAA